MPIISPETAARHLLTDIRTGRIVLDVPGLLSEIHRTGPSADLRRQEHQRGRMATRENERGDD